MKGGFGGLSVTKISFILVSLVCTTLLMFGWDKAPFLTSLFPQNQLQQVSADNFIGSPVKSMTSKKERHAGNNLSASASDGTFDKPKGKVSDSVTRRASVNGHHKRSNKACNYAKGEWVPDDHRPFYSGARCRLWLSEMWACRATDRVNFAYEKFRWQPKDCEVEEFNGSKFLRSYNSVLYKRQRGVIFIKAILLWYSLEVCVDGEKTSRNSELKLINVCALEKDGLSKRSLLTSFPMHRRCWTGSIYQPAIQHCIYSLSNNRIQNKICIYSMTGFSWAVASSFS